MITGRTPQPFKVFGLQRTGTNLMRALLSGNFRVEYLEESATGWKHGPMRMTDLTRNGSPIRFVLCVKNPYAWGSSCYRFFRRVCDGDVTMPPQFHRDPSMSFDEFMMTPSYEFETPIHRWNEMNRLWLNTLPAEHTLLVRQEDQVDDQLRILAEAERQLRLERQSEKMQTIDQLVDVDTKLRGAMNRAYYRDHEYLAEYSPSLLDRINQWVDKSLMQRFNYDVEQWPLADRLVNGLRLMVRPCTTDAADARQISFNPYHLDQIRHSALDIRTVLDVGAGVGAWTIFAKTLWPNCRVWACESCPRTFRVLRINSRRLTNVTPVAAKFGEGGDSANATSNVATPHTGETQTTQVEQVPTIGFEELFRRCGGVDLLRIGCPRDASRILACLAKSDLTRQIRCICGTLAADDESLDRLESLAPTHAFEKWAMPSGVFFRGERPR